MIESIQYNAALAITGTIRGSSREKLYQELGLESLHDRRWHRKLCFYYQIRHNICPSYLTELLPIEKSTCYNFRSNDSLMCPYIRTKQFKSTIFPSCIFNWNQLNPDIKNSSSLEIFKRALLKFIRPKAANVYKIHHQRGLKLLTRLRLGLSHLREHKFRHNFNDTIDPFRLCGTNSVETNEHFLLHCPNSATLRLKLFDSLRSNNILILPFVKSLKLIICYISKPPILLRSVVRSTKLIGQLLWALFIVIQSVFVLVYLFTCLSELYSNNKRADENVSSI